MALHDIAMAGNRGLMRPTSKLPSHSRMGWLVGRSALELGLGRQRALEWGVCVLRRRVCGEL